jgi:hypothetical protein
MTGTLRAPHKPHKAQAEALLRASGIRSGVLVLFVKSRNESSSLHCLDQNNPSGHAPKLLDALASDLPDPWIMACKILEEGSLASSVAVVEIEIERC